MTPEAVRLVETDARSAVELLAPFNEQTAFDVAAGARTLFALFTTPDGPTVGSAVLGRGELDLFIRQELRARGFGGDAARQLLGLAGLAGDGPLTAWSHGDHPAAQALAARFGFAPVRTLLKLRLEPLPPSPPAGRGGASAAFERFRPGSDDAEWLALNARVFAWHPEQGGMTERDLAERKAEPWFDAADFLLARDPDGRLIGYCWLKLEPPEGEIYVIGVAPEASGRGLGRALMTAGLARMSERGCTAAVLYTEADNEPAVRLYRSLGFRDETADVQYSQR